VDIHVIVNGTRFSIKQKLDNRALSMAGFKKLGLIGRANLPIRKLQGDVIFFAKNPILEVFDTELDFAPNLDTTQGTDMMFGTSCYIVYSNSLSRYIIAQLLKNDFMAGVFHEHLEQGARKALGEPVREYPLVWQEGDEIVSIEQSGSLDTTFFHWMAFP